MIDKETLLMAILSVYKILYPSKFIYAVAVRLVRNEEMRQAIHTLEPIIAANE